MTLHQLRILMAVAKYLNFTKASQALHISQPSVFLQFKLLEEEYGLKLHKKIGRGIELTQKGKLFIRYAKEILFRVENLDREFGRSLNAANDASLKIGGSYGPSVAFLPSLLAAFKRSHPEVHPTLRSSNSRMIEPMVLDSEVDIGLVTNPSGSSSLIYEHCRREEIVAFASSRDHAGNRKLTLAQLATAPLVFTSPQGLVHKRLAELILNQFNKEGLSPNIVMYCDSPEALKATVKMGVGIGILYRDVVEPDIRRGDLKIIKVPELEIPVHSFIVYQKERRLSATAQEFLSLLRQWPRRTRRPIAFNS